MNISRDIDSLSFYCVLKSGCSKEDCPSLLSCAEHIKDHLNVSSNLKWVDEKYCLAADVKRLQKTDIFIFPEFSGKAFEHLSTLSRALIIGPPCLEYCLTQDVNVPLGPSPVFNVAMNGLIVCPSGVPKAEKVELDKLVKWMGGHFSGDLNMNCTHLVTNTVRSKKYEEAATKGLSILQPDWVKDVWERNKEQTVLAEDPIFNRHRLRIFHNLVITSTNLSNGEKENIKKLIEDNGGTYSRVYRTRTVNILILKEDATFSQKYKESVRCKIDCLKPEWIYESVAKKYAMPIEDFRVSSVGHSTPTKVPGNLAHFSMISNISQISCASSTNGKDIDETRQSVVPKPSTSKSPAVDKTLTYPNRLVSPTPRPSTSKADPTNQDVTFNYKDRLKSLQLSSVKASGAFLDGCQIFLIGFTKTEAMKLNKIISNAGATLYTELSENISHVICGDATSNEIKNIHESKIQCKIVTLEWMFESERLMCPADEEKYLMMVKKAPPEPEQPSPASKKSIEAMNSSFKRPQVPRRKLDLSDAPTSVVKKYLPVPAEKTAAEATTSRIAMVSQMSNETYNSDVDAEDIEVLTFLQDTTFYLYGYEEEGTSQAIQDVENALGVVVDDKFKGTVDYILVPVDGVEKLDPPVKGKHIVNDLWLEDSVSNRGIVPIMYYHEAIVFDGLKTVLSGIHMTFSNITGSIKLYMAAVAGALGATIREQYPKKETPLLISSKADGSKYTAALKWNYPVVTEEWLMDTFREQKVKKIGNYLLGKATVNESIEVFRRLNQEEEPTQENAQENLEPEVAFLGDLTTEGNPINASLNRTAKRKSDDMDSDEDDFPLSRLASKMKTPVRHKRVALLALETPTNKKAADSPITSQVKSLYGDLETPVRNAIRNTTKLNINIDEDKTPGGSVKTPETPGCLKMPNTPLIADPKVGPSTQWGAKRRMDGSMFASITSNASKITSPNTPHNLELRRRYYQTLLGEDRYNEARRLEGTSQSQTPMDPTDCEVHTEGDSVKKLKDFLANKVASSAPKRLTFTEFSEPNADPQNTAPQASEQLVGWVDPSEYRPYNYPSAEETNVKAYNFHISGVLKNKQQIADMIEKLGGKVLTSESFDPSCTHLVFENLNRGEKTLGAVASGKWILAIEYLTNSTKCGYFLPEEDYEVGNKKLPYFSQLKDSEKSVAMAAYRWRLRIHGKIPGQAAINGALSGMTCLVLLGEQSDPIGRMIESGKGKVVQIKPPYFGKTEAKTITHIFVKSVRDHGISKEDLKFFKANGTQILTQKYLTSHLLDDVARDPAEFQV